MHTIRSEDRLSSCTYKTASPGFRVVGPEPKFNRVPGPRQIKRRTRSLSNGESREQMYKRGERDGVLQTLDPSKQLSLHAVPALLPFTVSSSVAPFSVVCSSRCTHARAPDDPRDQQQAVDVSFPPSGHPVPRTLVPMDHFIAFVLSEAERRRFSARHRLSVLLVFLPLTPRLPPSIPPSFSLSLSLLRSPLYHPQCHAAARSRCCR